MIEWYNALSDINKFTVALAICGMVMVIWLVFWIRDLFKC